MTLTSTERDRRARRARAWRRAPHGGLLAAALVAGCRSAPTDQWEYTRAFLIATVTDSSSEPVTGAAVRALVAQGGCPAAVTATVSEGQTDQAGIAAMLVRSVPVDSFNGCLRLQVLAPGNVVDTTTAGENVVFRSPSSGMIDTLRVRVRLTNR